MGKKDVRIDNYIVKSQPFARPILKHLRGLIHTACPDVNETIKWGFPHFDYNGIMCSMAAFKQHCAFTFWKATLMSDPKKILNKMGDTAMGQFGQIKNLSDLPDDKILISYIKEASNLNEKGVKLPAKSKSSVKKELSVPDYLLNALKKNKKAQTTFEKFSYTNKKEYVDWLNDAKTDETRKNRLEMAIEWMSEGKIRNWKYIKK